MSNDQSRMDLHNPTSWHTIVRRRSQTADSCDSAVETTFSSTLPQEPNRQSDHMLPHTSIAVDRDITRLSVDVCNAGQAPSRRLRRRARRIRRARARGRPPDNPAGSLRCLPLSPPPHTLTDTAVREDPRPDPDRADGRPDVLLHRARRRSQRKPGAERGVSGQGADEDVSADDTTAIDDLEHERSGCRVMTRSAKRYAYLA